MLSSLLTFAGCEKNPVIVPDDPIIPPSGNGLFTVSEDGNKVRFAPGNLEYDGSYHFAARQYDYGRLFGWGTGSDPTLDSYYVRDYPAFDDWGSYIDGDWRTLSKKEWNYVIKDRSNASDKCGAATVCGVHGMVLLPDNFSGGTFTAGLNGWNTNVYDISSWSDMEAAGAVFLPAAGFYSDRGLFNIGSRGHYWSSTPLTEYYAYFIYFVDGQELSHNYCERCDGMSVRLVQDY